MQQKLFLLVTLISLSLCSCSHIYYKSWELLGQEKRDLLSTNMKSFKDDQEDTKEEFQDSLERIRKEYNFKNGKLENLYDKLSSDYEDLKEEVDDLNSQYEKVTNIANDLFEEWKKEANSLSTTSYRTESLNKLKLTKIAYKKVAKRANNTKLTMEKTLNTYREQVIFLKHNLNAKIVGKLSSNLKTLESEMTKLIADIDASIDESSNFINLVKP